MFDAHCHLDQVGEDREEVLARSRSAGLRGAVLGGVDPEGWEDGDRFAAPHPDLWACWGLHPWTVARRGSWRDGVDALERRLSHARPVGLGETGLDHLSRLPRESHAPQEACFRAHVALARARDLPLVLHVVRAHDAALGVLRSEGLPAAGGMVHAFSAPAEVARRWLDLGFHLSIGGAVTWPGARHVREAARLIPADRLLVETDAPDLCPEPHRSRAREAGHEPRGEPWMVADVLRALAELRGEDVQTLADRTDANARRLFRLPAGATP